MTKEKRGRGRPQGSGKNDQQYLACIADMLVADTELKPTTAIKRVIYQRANQSELDDTLVRRLLGKWKTGRDELLDGARTRRDHQHARQAQIPSQGYPGDFKSEQVSQMLAATAPLLERMRSPEFQRAVLEANNHYQALVKNIANSPVANMLAKVAISPTAKRLADYANSPAAKRLAEYVGSLAPNRGGPSCSLRLR